MSLFTGNQRQYYDNSQEIVASAGQTAFTFNFSPAPATASDFDIFVNGSEVSASTYRQSASAAQLGSANLRSPSG